MLTDDETKAGFASLVLMLALMLPSLWWSGFALATLWGWFIAPLGAATLSTWHAAGLLLMVSFLWRRARHDLSKKDVAKAVAHSALNPAFALAFGWIVKGLM